LKEVEFREVNIDSCASQFHCYPVDELQCSDKQTLHQILESSSLENESEDALLRTLISLGPDYFEF
jgi:hypothetical protein